MLSESGKSFLKEHHRHRVVFTNGCFDIIHSGHVAYLNQAKLLGDVLFVGLNSDQSVQRLKGKSRPIVEEQDRKEVLENLRCVDFVEIFNQDTPYELIKSVRPNILVKGGDWDAKDIVGSDIVQSYGGQVLSLQFRKDRSTTNIIQKIQELKS